MRLLGKQKILTKFLTKLFRKNMYKDVQKKSFANPLKQRICKAFQCFFHGLSDWT